MIDQGVLFKDRKRKPPAEAQVSLQVKHYLRARNIYYLRLNSGKVYYKGNWIHLCPEGTPDLFCLYRSKAVFIETKRIGEKPTEEQLRTHAFIVKNGGWAIVAYTLDEVVRELKAIDQLIDSEKKPA
jgi:hypothetical protein